MTDTNDTTPDGQPVADENPPADPTPTEGDGAGDASAAPADDGAVAEEPPAGPPAGPQYKILAPYLSYPSGGVGGAIHRPVEGDVVDDIPAESIGWLLADGLIEAA